MVLREFFTHAFPFLVVGTARRDEPQVVRAAVEVNTQILRQSIAKSNQVADEVRASMAPINQLLDSMLEHQKRNRE
jgi:hypothetical protein